MNYVKPTKNYVSASGDKPKSFTQLVKNFGKAEKAKATRAANKKKA